MFYATVFLLPVGFVLVNGASFWQGLKQPEICDTKECHNTADQITKWMNTAYKPCDDFYEYSCGCWTSPENKAENQKVNRSLGCRDDFVTVHLKNFLLDDTIDNESKLFKMLRQFMTMCLDEDSIDSRGSLPAAQLFREVGGWPVLEKDWSEKNWDFLKVEKLFGVFFKFELLPLPPEYIWTLTIKPDYISPNISFGEISEGFEAASAQLYYKNLCALADSFGADHDIAKKDLKDSVEFEIALTKFAREMDLGDFDITDFSKLQKNISWIDWNQLLSSTLPDSVTLSENDKIILFKPNLIRDLESLINEYPKRTVANYMMMKAALSITKYLSPKVNNITIDEDNTRFKICVGMLKDSSLKGILASYIARQTIEDTKVAKDLTEDILNELQVHLEEIKWIDETTRSTVLTALRNAKRLVGFPAELLDVGLVEDLYKEVKINTSYFFEAAIDSAKWVKKDSMRNVGKSGKEMTLRDQIKETMSVNAYYRPLTNDMVVSAEFLHFLPLFSHKVPAYVNYGNLGFPIAHELIHALDFQSEMIESAAYRIDASVLDQPIFKWGDEATEAKYEEKKQCIIDQYTAFNDTKYTGEHLDGMQTQREDIADNGALKLALKAYRKFAAKLPSPEPKLPTLEQYSIEQLFILSLANFYCEVPVKQALHKQHLYDEHSQFEFRVKGIMMNSPDFSNLFSCKNNDPMNPKKKCEVW